MDGAPQNSAARSGASTAESIGSELVEKNVGEKNAALEDIYQGALGGAENWIPVVFECVAPRKQQYVMLAALRCYYVFIAWKQEGGTNLSWGEAEKTECENEPILLI